MIIDQSKDIKRDFALFYSHHIPPQVGSEWANENQTSSEETMSGRRKQDLSFLLTFFGVYSKESNSPSLSHMPYFKQMPVERNVVPPTLITPIPELG